MEPRAAPRIVVIGAGMGGLAAAIRLARRGAQVTVLESQPGPGGKMRSLPSPAGPVDAGPTVLTLRHVFDELFRDAGDCLDDHLELIAQPLLARHWWPDGSRLDLHADAETNAAAIAAFAGPNAADDFRRFNRLSADLFAAFDRPMMRAARPNALGAAVEALRRPAIWSALMPGRTLAAQLNRCFRDPRLRQLFGRYATYVGGSPDLSPAVLALIWQAEAAGVWAVRGGMGQLAQALAALAGRLGADLHYGLSAQRIIRQGGRVSGVTLSDGRTLGCDAVVFNGDPAALLAGLLGNGPQQAVPRAAAHPRSLSGWVWSFAAVPAAPVDLVHHNVFFTADPAMEFGPLARGEMPIAPSLYVCAQDRGASPAPEPGAMERFEIIMNAPAKAALAAKEIETCRARTFPPLARFGLTFSPPPADQALMTPAGFAQMFPGSQGALYGRSPQSTLASFQRPSARSGLPGLYLAGSGAHPGAGVPMAALSGRHAAEAIMTDLTSGSRWPRMAMPGGMSTASRMTGRAR